MLSVLARGQAGVSRLVSLGWLYSISYSPQLADHLACSLPGSMANGLAGPVSVTSQYVNFELGIIVGPMATRQESDKG